MAIEEEGSKRRAMKRTSAKKKGSARAKSSICPDDPFLFFGKIKIWASLFAVWAQEVDGCYIATCETDKRRAQLANLCAEITKFAKDAKKWADDVEECFQTQCGGGPGHTQPPDPPFP